MLNGIAQCSIAFAGMLPRTAGLLLFGMLGKAVFLIPHADRKRTVDHLRLIYGNEWSERALIGTASAVYRELAKNLFDMFLLPRLSKTAFDSIVSHDPLETVEREYAKGSGCIMITAHTGCFQMPLHFFAMRGYECFAIGKKLHDEKLDKTIQRTRSGRGISYMYRSESPIKIVRNLQEGKIFGVLIDQDTAVEGVFAPFLGLPAFTPSGPVKMAMKFDIPLFVVTTARISGNKHHIFIDGPVTMARSGNPEADLVHNVTLVNERLCRTIRRYPSQWVWMHKRWKRAPESITVEGEQK